MILILKIIIFIVVLLTTYYFTYTIYVNSYVTNMDEIRRHLYLSNNPDKDTSGIYKTDKIDFNQFISENDSDNKGTTSGTTPSTPGTTPSTTSGTTSSTTPGTSSSTTPGTSSSTPGTSSDTKDEENKSTSDTTEEKIDNDEPINYNSNVCSRCSDEGTMKDEKGNKKCNAQMCFCKNDYKGSNCNGMRTYTVGRGAMSTLSPFFILMQGQDIVDLAIIARNSSKLVKPGKVLSGVLDGAAMYSKAHGKVLQGVLKGDDLLEAQRILGALDTKYSKLNNVLKGNKRFYNSAMTLQDVNDALFDSATKIDDFAARLKSSGKYTDEAIEAVVKPLRSLNSVKDTKAFRNVAKFMDPDQGKALKLALAQDNLKSIARTADNLDSIKDLTNLDDLGLKNADELAKVDDLLKSVKKGLGRMKTLANQPLDELGYFGRFLGKRAGRIITNSVDTVADARKAIAILSSTQPMTTKAMSKIDDLKRIIDGVGGEGVKQIGSIAKSKKLNLLIGKEAIKNLKLKDKMFDFARKGLENTKDIANSAFQAFKRAGGQTEIVQRAATKVGNAVQDATKTVSQANKLSNINGNNIVGEGAEGVAKGGRAAAKKVAEALAKNLKGVGKKIDAGMDIVRSGAKTAGRFVKAAAKTLTNTVGMADTVAEAATLLKLQKTGMKALASTAKGVDAAADGAKAGSKMGKMATRFSQGFGVGMALVGFGVCMVGASAGEDGYEKEEEMGACGIQLAIDLAIEAALMLVRPQVWHF